MSGIRNGKCYIRVRGGRNSVRNYRLRDLYVRTV